MKSIINTIKLFLKKLSISDKIWIGVVVLFILFITINPVHAQVIDEVTGFVQKGLVSLLSIILSFIVKMLFTMIDVLIGVLGYNEFTRETVVTQGWVYVRNIANMFFSISMLIIVYGTILGTGNSYKSNLPKLLIMAILVNFSKTITGFLIDISQVPTLTFLYAFKASATANFTSGLAIDKYVQFSGDFLADNPRGLDFSSVSIGLLLGIVIGGFALLIISMMAVFMLIRVIVLWMLIVLSPLAFVGRGIDMLKGHTWGPWFSELQKWLVTGPVMSFFLWMAMIMMVNPDATTAHMKPDSSASIWASELGNLDYIIRVALTLGMLYGALYAAQKLGGTVAGNLAGRVKRIGTASLKLGAAAAVGGTIGGASLLAKGVGRGAGALASVTRDKQNKFAQGISKASSLAARGLGAAGSVGFDATTSKGRARLVKSTESYFTGKWSNFKQESKRKYDIAATGSSDLERLDESQKTSVLSVQDQYRKDQGYKLRDYSKDADYRKGIQDKMTKGESLDYREKMVVADLVNNIAPDKMDEFAKTFGGLQTMAMKELAENPDAFKVNSETGEIEKDEKFATFMRTNGLPALFSSHPEFFSDEAKGEVINAFDNYMNNTTLKGTGVKVKYSTDTEDLKINTINAIDELADQFNDIGDGADEVFKKAEDTRGVGTKDSREKNVKGKALRAAKDAKDAEGNEDDYSDTLLRRTNGKGISKILDQKGVVDATQKKEILRSIQDQVKVGKKDEEIINELNTKFQLNLTDTPQDKALLDTMKSFTESNHIFDKDGLKKMHDSVKKKDKQFVDNNLSADMALRINTKRAVGNSLETQKEFVTSRIASNDGSLSHIKKNNTSTDQRGRTKDQIEKENESLKLFDKYLDKKISEQSSVTYNPLSNLNNRSLENVSFKEIKENGSSRLEVEDDFLQKQAGSIPLYFDAKDSNIDSSLKKSNTTMDKKTAEKAAEYLRTKRQQALDLDSQQPTDTSGYEALLKDAQKDLKLYSGEIEPSKAVEDVKKQIKDLINSLDKQILVADKAAKESHQDGKTVLKVGNSDVFVTPHQEAIARMVSTMKKQSVDESNKEISEAIRDVRARDVENIKNVIQKINEKTQDAFAHVPEDDIAKLLYSIKLGVYDPSNGGSNKNLASTLQKIVEDYIKDAKVTFSKEDEIRNKKK